MRKFLVVNMNYMGDALLTTPALAALRNAYPEAQIDTVVGAGAAAEVLSGNPDLNHIIARTAPGSGARVMQTYRLLREGRYTDAIILPPLPAYAAAAWLARTPRRVGQSGRGMNRFLTDLRQTRSVHMADALLDTMPVPSDARPTRRGLVVTVERAARDEAEAMLTAAGIDLARPLIIVNVGATRPQKRWFAASFAATLDGLAEVPCVLVGAGEGDMALAEEVLRTVRRAKPVNLVGRTGVKTLAATLQCGSLLISADSGPMHLATAVGTPSLALFGSTDPGVTGPYDERSLSIYKSLSCAPCGNHPTCGGRYDCLRQITPEEVALAARGLLRSPLRDLPLLPFPRREERLRSEGDKVGLGSKTAGGGASIQRILIATKFRFIGDTLLAIPIFRAARAQWPDAHIALLTGKNARVLLQSNPYLDEIIEFDPYKADRGLPAYLKLIHRVREGQFDLCLALNRSFHSALAPSLGGVRLRAGFNCEGRGPLLNRPVPYDRDKSEVSCYFDVLRAVAPEVPVNPALELWISAEETAAAAQRLREAIGLQVAPSHLLGIQPGASQAGKRWGAAEFAQVADALIMHYPERYIVLIGGPDETDAAEEMLSYCRDETRSRTISFAGALDLRGSLALVSHLGLFIGNDTAVMHSAVALGVQTVALFGPTNPRKWGNYGPCHRVLESPDGSMASISASDVLESCRELLASPRTVEV